MASKSSSRHLGIGIATFFIVINPRTLLELMHDIGIKISFSVKVVILLGLVSSIAFLICTIRTSSLTNEPLRGV